MFGMRAALAVGAIVVSGGILVTAGCSEMKVLTASDVGRVAPDLGHKPAGGDDGATEPSCDAVSSGSKLTGEGGDTGTLFSWTASDLSIGVGSDGRRRLVYMVDEHPSMISGQVQRESMFGSLMSQMLFDGPEIPYESRRPMATLRLREVVDQIEQYEGQMDHLIRLHVRAYRLGSKLQMSMLLSRPNVPWSAMDVSFIADTISRSYRFQQDHEKEWKAELERSERTGAEVWDIIVDNWTVDGLPSLSFPYNGFAGVYWKRDVVIKESGSGEWLGGLYVCRLSNARKEVRFHTQTVHIDMQWASSSGTSIPGGTN